MANLLAHGVEAKFYAKAEATFGTAAQLAGTNAIALESLKLQPEMQSFLSKAHVGTGSAQAMILGKRSGKWSLVSELRPNAAGTAPDIGADVLKTAFGTETVVGATSVTYALTDALPGSLQLGAYLGTAAYEGANGAWVEQVDFEIGGDYPKVTVQGGYASHVWVYQTTVGTGGASNGATTCPYANVAGDKGNIGVGASVTIGSQTNTGLGFLITAVNDTPVPPTFTFTPALSGSVSAGDAIIPVVPAQTLGGTPVAAIAGALTVDGTAVQFQSAKISFKTGVSPRDKETAVDRAVGLMRGMREITGEITVQFIDSVSAPIFGRSWAGTTRALVLRIGPNTAGAKVTFNVPKAFIEVPQMDVPDAEAATFTFKFRALQNSAAADEFTVVLD